MKMKLQIIILIVLLYSCNQTEQDKNFGPASLDNEKVIGKDIYNDSLQENIDIKFTFHHSMRIPYQEVIISITPFKDNAKLKLTCDPMQYDGKHWNPNPIDTIITVSKYDYNLIIDNIQSFNYNEIINESQTSGLDGTVCELEYGSWQNSVIISIWSPDYDTKNRKLDKFLETCEFILKCANLNPKEILE